MTEGETRVDYMERDSASQTEQKLLLGDDAIVGKILGSKDENLRILEKGLFADVVIRGNSVILSGTARDVSAAKAVFEHLTSLAAEGVQISPAEVIYALSMGGKADGDLMKKLAETLYTTSKGQQIRARTIGQWRYNRAIRDFDLVFGIGPAGTGKTFLAVTLAVLALKQQEVSRIVLTRPAVEAGEKLGFLPGDLQDKVDPYLRPVYDALFAVMGQGFAEKYMERGIIEVVPLAYMRGRTLDDAFIILDEAQNTTSLQMKMFLTRLGNGSKAVVNGDITQIDLPFGQASGLIEAEQRLKHIKEIAFCYFSKADIVRHPLVQKIIEAYETQL